MKYSMNTNTNTNTNIEYLLNENNKGRTLVFDLDDTIYPEFSFLSKQYLFVAKHYLGSEFNSGYNFLCNEFKNSGREGLFTKFIYEFNLNANINDVLKIFRNYSVTYYLKPYVWFDMLFSDSSLDYLYVITNGNVTQQKEKVKRLKLENKASDCFFIYANNFRAKPFDDSYNYLKKIKPIISPIYIGDSVIDRKFSDGCEMEFFDSKVFNS